MFSFDAMFIDDACLPHVLWNIVQTVATVSTMQMQRIQASDFGVPLMIDALTMSKLVCRLQSMAAEQRKSDSVIAKGQQDSWASRSMSDGLQREISSLQRQLQVGYLSCCYASTLLRAYVKCWET